MHTPWGSTDDVVTLVNGDTFYFFKIPHKVSFLKAQFINGVCVCVCTYVWICACINCGLYLPKCIHACTLYVCACMCVYVCVCMCVCLCASLVLKVCAWCVSGRIWGQLRQPPLQGLPAQDGGRDSDIRSRPAGPPYPRPQLHDLLLAQCPHPHPVSLKCPR